MKIWNNFDGMVTISITSAHPASSLLKIQKAGICLYNIIASDSFTIRFSAKKSDLRSITQICQKKGDRVDIEGYAGYIYSIICILKRPIFLAGFIGWLILALWLPTKILFVTVDGANNISESYIIESAADCGISMGANSKDVRSEKTKNTLLTKIPSLQWVGVTTKGCVATIHISEKTPNGSFTQKPAVSDILSTHDAIISEITTYAGTALCKPGQAVMKGQALISCYQDNGQMLLYTGASGEVYGQTTRYLQAVTPLHAFKRTDIIAQFQNFYIIIGKNPIKFQKDSGILDASCVKMYEVKKCILPGGFQLPIWLVTEYVTQYALEPVSLVDCDFQWLNLYAENYLSSIMVAGSILQNHVEAQSNNDAFYIFGTYNCSEMIADYSKGISRNNGKDS